MGRGVFALLVGLALVIVAAVVAVGVLATELLRAPAAPHAPRPSVVPTPRYATAADVLDGEVIVVGGVRRGDAGDETVALVEAYDPETRTWTRCAPLATPRAFAAAAAYRGRLYVFGGLDASGATLSSVEAWDPATDTWTACPPMEIALSRLAATRHMDAGVVLYGGLRADMTNGDEGLYFGVFGYGNTWRRWGPLLPMARHGLGLVDADDRTERMLAVGGYDESGPTDRVDWWGVGRVHVRDAEGRLLHPGVKVRDGIRGTTHALDQDYDGYGWWDGPALHQARGFHGVARIGKLVYAVGGRCARIPPTEVLDLDDLAAGWRTAAPLPKDLCRFALVAWEGHLLAFGGETESGRAINADVLDYDPAADTWSVR